jgi:hypothetical protein
MSTPLHPGPRFSPLFLGVQVLLVVLAVSRYDATSFLFRGTDTIDFYNWFWRYRFLGFLSFFDLLVSVLIAMAAAGVAASGRWRPRCFDPLLQVLLAVVALSAAIRFLQLDVEDTYQGFLYQLRNYAYFAAAYFLASRLRWPVRRLRWFAGLAAGLAVLTVVLSWWEIGHTPPQLVVSKYGRTVNVRDLSDYLFTFFLQFWIAALLLERVPRQWWQKALLTAVLVHSLYGVFFGVGKGVLIVYPGVFFYFAWYYGFFHRRWFVAGLASALVLVTILGGYILLNVARIGSESPFYVYTTFSSSDLSLATRGWELMNFASNLYHRKALLLGIGLGNKWYEFWAPPGKDLGAFPPGEWGSDWHLGMHVPFLRLLLDFGILGTALVLIFFGACFLSTMKALRSGRFDRVTGSFMLSSWAVIGYQVSVNNLSGPKTNLFAGLLLGALAGILGEPASAEQA